MSEGYPLDLVVLVPGKDDREAIDGLLSKRSKSLGIRPIHYEILVHPRRDPGCFHEAQHILQPYFNRAAYAMVIFDHEGSGQEARPAGEIADDLEDKLRQKGWQNRVCVLVIEPELEIWIWSHSPQVDVALGWTGRGQRLRTWLLNKGFWPDGDTKPLRPKECLIEALREVRVQRSSAIYRELAEKVGLQRCQDPTFDKLKNVLRSWFPG
ncbi:MAG: hypothetical protein JRF57_14765 [Deltaproteobacteria bacterium]|nr:hypothetical protein [Deltaproteobacteria bacterium]MBW2017728.1 hypothetical protein [Deltaproteobacteria bacterium]MBW2304963.1 hypothetical protein [Deltaproteobacteria bacterium]